MPTNASLTFEDGGGMLFEGRISPDRTEAPAGGGGGGVCPPITVEPQAPTAGGSTITYVAGIDVDEADGHKLLPQMKTVEIPEIPDIPEMPDIPDITFTPGDPTAMSTLPASFDVVIGASAGGHAVTLNRQTITISAPPVITEEEVAPEAPPSGTNPIFHNVVEAVRVDDEDGHHLLATVRELPMIKEHVVAGLRYNTDNHTLEWRSSSDLGNEDLEGGAETWTTVLTFVAFDAAEEP